MLLTPRLATFEDTSNNRFYRLRTWGRAKTESVKKPSIQLHTTAPTCVRTAVAHLQHLRRNFGWAASPRRNGTPTKKAAAVGQVSSHIDKGVGLAFDPVDRSVCAESRVTLDGGSGQKAIAQESRCSLVYVG